jgi:hypothetical protein
MSTSTRRPARGQALPLSEAQTLASLRDFNLFARAAQLYEAGWTLRAIGEAFEPPKSRSTVRSWVDRAANSSPTIDLPTAEVPVLLTPEAYIPVKPASPGISPTERARIEALAPIARKYRSGMHPMHPAAQANTNLTLLCKTLNDANVSVQELADTAGVTYRAMAKRLGRA